MSIRAIAAALDLMPADVTAKARLVAIAVADTVSDEMGYGWPSIATLCRRTGLCRATVYRCLTELEDVGVLTRVARYEQDRRTTSAYVWDLWITLPGGDR